MPRMSVGAHHALLLWTYVAGDLATWVFLTFFDGYGYTWWNWPIALGANAMLAQMWPIYWLILRPMFG